MYSQASMKGKLFDQLQNDKKIDELTQYLNAHTTTLFVGAPKSGKTPL